MKLLEQILSELGADGAKSITLVPESCCYLKSVKSVASFSPSKIAVKVGKLDVTVEGENMEIGGYFEGDLIVRGRVTGVKIG